MKLLNSLIITILLTIGYSKQAYSQSLDHFIVWLEYTIEDASENVNFLLLRLEATADNECSQRLYQELLTLKEETYFLREEFDQHILTFFNDQSDVYFTLFEMRLTNLETKYLSMKHRNTMCRIVQVAHGTK